MCDWAGKVLALGIKADEPRINLVLAHLE